MNNHWPATRELERQKGILSCHRDNKCTKQLASIGLDKQEADFINTSLNEGSLGNETRVSEEEALTGINVLGAQKSWEWVSAC